MLASLPVLALWCGLRIWTRNSKNDRMSMLVLVLIVNSLRTIAQTNISEILLFVIPLQNHENERKVFICLPYIALTASVRLGFSYQYLVSAVGVLLIIWASTHKSTPIRSSPKMQKNQSYSRTWVNRSDSLIVSQSETYPLVVTSSGKLVSQTPEMHKLIGTDDPCAVQAAIISIVVRKVHPSSPKKQMTSLLESISSTYPKLRILDCTTPFGDHYMIELAHYHEHIGVTFTDIRDIKEYHEKRTTRSLMNQLFRSFSHEFSTSLNCIRILAENACEDVDDDYIVTTCIQPILNSCYILNSIVQDVRDFSLILSKNFILTIQLHDVSYLINEVADLFRQQLTMKGVELVVKAHETHVHTDGQRVKQILTNLLSNAQKFTFKGSVTISVQEIILRDQLYVKVSVADTGAGMDPDTQFKLQEFLVAPHKRKQNLNYGLGLMISHRICNGLSPRYEPGIHFESVRHQGSQFWFFLEDLKTAEDLISRKTIRYNKVISSGRSFLEQSFLISPSDKKRQSSFTFSLKGKQKLGLNEKNSENLTDQDEHVAAPYIFREGPKKPPNKYPAIDLVVSEYAEEPAKILIVDDEYVNIYALTAMLSRLNLKCDSAHNGLEGLNKFKEHQYLVILMDVEMPLMNGIQATQLILEYCHSADLDPPIIIAQTAYTDMQTKHMCKEAGMDYFLQKPISTVEIRQILQTLNL